MGRPEGTLGFDGFILPRTSVRGYSWAVPPCGTFDLWFECAAPLREIQLIRITLRSGFDLVIYFKK